MYEPQPYTPTWLDGAEWLARSLTYQTSTSWLNGIEYWIEPTTRDVTKGPEVIKVRIKRGCLVCQTLICAAHSVSDATPSKHPCSDVVSMNTEYIVQ
jgi:hypothetical protein